MCTGNDTQKITIEELGERWEMLLWELGCSRLKVTENFKSGITKSFIITGLQMEFEDDYGFCFDCYNNEVLIENDSTLLLFLKECLTSIILIPVGDGYCQERLMFGNKLILIEKAS